MPSEYPATTQTNELVHSFLLIGKLRSHNMPTSVKATAASAM